MTNDNYSKLSFFHIIVLVFLTINKDIFKKIAYNDMEGETYDNQSNRNRYGWNVFNRC